MNVQDGGKSSLPQHWVFGLAAIVILIAVGSVVVWLFSASTQLQFPIVIALLCFALASISNLLFVARTNVQASLPMATITLGGPAVTWIATLLIFSFLFPAPVLRPDDFLGMLRRERLQHGWITYSDWVKRLGPLRDMVLRDEAANIRQLLDTTYYRGSDRRKLSSPSIQVLFVYFDDNQALKFQHITGTPTQFADIYFKGHASIGGATNIFLSKQRGAITVSDLGIENEWRQVTSDPVDCLIITFYHQEGMLPEGDLVFVNTTKYLKDGNGTLDFGILAPQNIELPKAWLLRPLEFPLPDEVPVRFQKIDEPWNRNTDPLLSKYADWMTLINQQQPAGRISPEAIEFLKTVRNRLPQPDFTNFQTSNNFISKYWLHLENVTDAVGIGLARK